MLIYCKECNKQISDKAISCPNCGYPISKTNNVQKNINGCPKCNSGNISRQAVLQSERTKGKSETVKKSAFERSVNKSARKGMNFITGGLWGIFTSPKSEYKEKSKYTTSNIHCIYCNCMNCGYQWKE